VTAFADALNNKVWIASLGGGLTWYDDDSGLQPLECSRDHHSGPALLRARVMCASPDMGTLMDR